MAEVVGCRIAFRSVTTSCRRCFGLYSAFETVVERNGERIGSFLATRYAWCSEECQSADLLERMLWRTGVAR